MRALTLNEKIGIKGVLAFHGVSPLPALTMRTAMHYWGMVNGCSVRLSISNWATRRNHKRGVDMVAPVRVAVDDSFYPADDLFLGYPI